MEERKDHQGRVKRGRKSERGMGKEGRVREGQ